MPPISPDPFDRMAVFRHLNADKAPLYRAILRAFVDAKHHFALHLRPREILQRIRSGADDATGELAAQADGEVVDPTHLADLHEEGVDTALGQLCEWGNLERHVDTTEVTTVADFYRPRYLYQITPLGEAAERALIEFHRQLERPGELQTAALHDIQELLSELLGLAAADPIDAGKADRNLTQLSARFEELTARAQTFLSSLQRTIDLQGVTIDDFLLYKERLIEYLERFIGELVVATANIAKLLEQIEAQGIRPVLDAIARRRLDDRLAVDAAAERREAAEWRGRWRGLASWFLGDDGTSQAEILRARARSAIPALLHAVAAIHDRRVTRSDRSTDLRVLARWFAEAETDRDAHRLWHAAFGLGGSRHLRVDTPTLDAFERDGADARTSWLDAPPLRLTPRLRATGRYRRPGRTAKIVDRDEAKRQLARLAAEQREQIDAARRALFTEGPTRLSALGRLDPGAFRLFLDLLGQALARRVDQRAGVVAQSSDGAIAIALDPLGDGSTATLVTDTGRFSGRDHLVTIGLAGDDLGRTPP